MKANPKHIAFVIGSMRTGGAERATLNLANQIAERGFRVDLVLLHRSGEFLSQVSDKVNVIHLNRRKASQGVKVFTRYLEMMKPDLLFVVQNHIQLMALLAIRRASWKGKLILNEQSTFSKNLRGLKGFVQKVISRILFSRVDAFTAVSQGVKEDLEREIPSTKNRIHVIPNPIVTSHLLSVKDSIVHHPFFENGNQVIISAGRFAKSKNFELLIRAFSKIKSSDKIKLIILGDGERAHSLKHLITDLKLNDAVSLPGFVADPAVYFSKSDLFVLSSDYEGLPGVILEALACGCKVVSTDCESGPREILTDGKFGWLTPVGDENSLVNTIQLALNTPVDQKLLVERAMDFHEDKVVDLYLNLFNELSHINTKK